MKSKDFLFFTLVLFFLKFLLLPILNWHTAVDFFAVFILALALADRSFKEKVFSVFAVIIFFDIFSGSIFGSVSIALILAILLIFLVQKFLLASEQNYFFSFLIIFFCYHIYIFTLSKLEQLSQIFNFYNFFILSVFIITFIYVAVAGQKKISHI